MKYVGIDVGLDGGIVALNEDLSVFAATPMPTLGVGKTKRAIDEAAIVEFMEAVERRGNLFVVVEKAQAMPGQGVTSMFSYGVGFGVLRGILSALHIPHELTTPQSWQNVILRGVQGDGTKGRSVLKCQQAIPTLNLKPGRYKAAHDGLADSGCIALFAHHLRPPRTP